LSDQQSKINNIYEKAENDKSKFDFLPEETIIDINNLHSELQMNSEMTFQANARRAKVQKIVDQLDELKKQTRSTLITQCVKDPSLCDPITKKYSDKKAEAYYRNHPEYIEVIDALIQAKHELGRAEGAQKAWEGRRWEIKDLVSLVQSQYFQSEETGDTRVVLNLDQATANYLDSIDLPEKDIPAKKEPEAKQAAPEKKAEVVEKDKTEAGTETKRSRRRSRK